MSALGTLYTSQDWNPLSVIGNSSVSEHTIVYSCMCSVSISSSRYQPANNQAFLACVAVVIDRQCPIQSPMELSQSPPPPMS